MTRMNVRRGVTVVAVLLFLVLPLTGSAEGPMQKEHREPTPEQKALYMEMHARMEAIKRECHAKMQVLRQEYEPRFQALGMHVPGDGPRSGGRPEGHKPGMR